MEIKKELITPKRAEELLLRNLGNRNFRTRVIDRYAQEMKDGRWMSDTGEAIKLSTSGNLLDGQHRLLAIVKSGIPIELHVCYGVSAEVFKVLDSGVPRNATDAFQIKGILYAAVLPAVITLYEALKAGTNVNGVNPTTSELLELYNSRPVYWNEIAKKTMAWYGEFGKILPPSIIGGCFALFYDLNENDAYRFMGQLCSGMGIQNTTVGLLRKKMIDDRISPIKMTSRLRIGFIIKTWNYFRKQENMKVLKFNPDTETFPLAI